MEILAIDGCNRRGSYLLYFIMTPEQNNLIGYTLGETMRAYFVKKWNSLTKKEKAALIESLTTIKNGYHATL